MAIKIAGTTVINDSRNIENIGIATATTFSGQVSSGVGTVTRLTGNSLNYSGIGTIGSVTITSGIVTATAGVVTYYGDGSKLTGVAAAGSGGANDITSSLFF